MEVGLHSLDVNVRCVIILLLCWSIIEVETDVLINFQEVLLTRHAESARRAVLVDVLRPKAVDRVRSEPGAGDAAGAVLVSVGLCPIRFPVKAKLRHNVLDRQGVQENVGKEGNHASKDHGVAIHTRVARLAVRFENEAAEHETTWDAHHPLGPPIHHLVRVVAGLDRAEDTIVVEGIDVHVGQCHSEEHLDVKASGEEEDEHRNHRVKHEVGVAREVEDQASQKPFSHESLHSGLGAHNGQHHLVGRVDGGNRFNQEWDEEGGRESVRIKVVGQQALHRVRLKAVGELLKVLQQCAIIGLHAQANVDPVCHHVRGD
mmetsp:Transcript_12758/g.29148  ORF Transcript_12758/g.29148 Transcript_12758/m.29148 type:complete len:317 (-) Transcript_12758:508-1458(-)